MFARCITEFEINSVTSAIFLYQFSPERKKWPRDDKQIIPC